VIQSVPPRARVPLLPLSRQQLVKLHDPNDILRCLSSAWHRNIDRICEALVDENGFWQWRVPFNPAYHPALNAWKESALALLRHLPQLRRYSSRDRLLRAAEEEMAYVQRNKGDYLIIMRSRLGIQGEGSNEVPCFDFSYLRSLSTRQLHELHRRTTTLVRDDVTELG
jgi:hypothetical protein